MVAQCSERIIHPDAIRAGKAMLPESSELEGMERFFKIMGDATRLRILHALLAGELCVCDIAETLAMGVSAVSHQLAVLKAGRLVAYRREGKVVFYRLSDAHVSDALELIRTHVQEARA